MMFSQIVDYIVVNEPGVSPSYPVCHRWKSEVEYSLTVETRSRQLGE